MHPLGLEILQKGCQIQSSNPENFDYDFTTNEGGIAPFCRILKNRHLKCNFYIRRNKSAKCPKTRHFSAFYDRRIL